MKYLYKALILLTLISCSPKQKIKSGLQPEKKSYLGSAQNFLEKKLEGANLKNKIVLDTTMRHTSNMVLFNVQNDSLNTERNMILVHVNNDFTVDTIFTKIDEEQIKKHIKEPSNYPLLVSRIGAIKLAKQNGIKEGIEPWQIHLVCYAGKKDDVQWTIRNMEKKSSSGAYRASGKSINIKVVTEEVDLGGWQAIE